jgi:hypothetical protein
MFSNLRFEQEAITAVPFIVPLPGFITTVTSVFDYYACPFGNRNK